MATKTDLQPATEWKVPDHAVSLTVSVPLSLIVRARDMAKEQRTSFKKIVANALAKGLGVK